MPRVMEETIDFAHTVAIDQIDRHDILCPQAAGVAQRERRTFDRAANRAPDVDFGEAILEQSIGFLWQKIADPVRRGFEGVVVVHELGRRASALFAAFREQRISNNVIENHYALGAGYPLQQALDFGVVNRFDLIGIVKSLTAVSCSVSTKPLVSSESLLSASRPLWTTTLRWTYFPDRR